MAKTKTKKDDVLHSCTNKNGHCSVPGCKSRLNEMKSKCGNDHVVGRKYKRFDAEKEKETFQPIEPKMHFNKS